jgi:uroporphyrinogen decarboxylase
MTISLPLTSPSPDAAECIAILTGQSKSTRVPLVEYIVDDVVMRPILTQLMGRKWVPWGADRSQQEQYLDNLIAFWLGMGYDFVRLEQSLPLPERADVVPDAAPGSDKERSWPDEHRGTIQTWGDFENYPWPSVADFDFSAFEYLNAHLPDGMGLICSHGGGVFEHLSWIMSLEGLSHALFDAPDLVQATADRLGNLMVEFTSHLLDLNRLVAIFPGDDMGYRSATMISPRLLRELVLPWHKRFASMAHARGVPYFLHSCGKILAIMDDLITDVGIDGKHSYEDAIIPAPEFQKLYGDRIAVLGGVDLNILAGGSPDDVARRTRELIETCGPHGRYAVGSGNSVPSYVPVKNYLAMIGEAHRQAGTI